MEPIIIAEVLENSGKVHARYKLTQFPATLGRAYHCDLILNDDFVSPQHARIDLDEHSEFRLTDLGSENGTQRLPSLQAITFLTLGSDTLVRMGHTLIRLRRPDYALAPTRIDTLTSSRFTRFFTSATTLVALALLLLAVLGLNSYQSSAQTKTLGQLLLENIEIVVLVPLWAGVWALLGRIFVHHAAYVSHALIACTSVLAYFCIATLVEYYAFNFSALLSADILLQGLLGLLMFALLYGHLRFTTLFSPRRIGLIALTSALVMVGLSGITTYVQGLEFNDELLYPPELKPPQFLISHEKSLEDFMHAAEKIPHQLDSTN